MPIEWSIDTTHGVARVLFRPPVGLEESIAMVRNVASATSILGDCSVLIDGRELASVPDFELVLKVTQLAVELRNKAHPAHYALIAHPGSSSYGKGRQVAALMSSLGVTVDIFDSEEAARAWCTTHNPRLSRR